MYKKLDLDANVWSIFVHKTEDFEVDTLIECGASCNSKEQQCDMFIFQKEKLKCHVGTFENSNQNYLNGQTGTNPAFLYIGKYIFYPLFVLSNILELALNYYLDLNIFSSGILTHEKTFFSVNFDNLKLMFLLLFFQKN